jgi:hypothetical protein
MLYVAKVILLALAGAGYLAAALWRWRSLATTDRPPGRWLLWSAVGFHALAVVLILSVNQHYDLAFAAGGSLGAALVALLLTRLQGPQTPGLLLAPVGLMALVVAGAALVDQPEPGLKTVDPAGRSVVFFVHVVFMTANLAAALISGAAAALYLVASRQLKAPSPRALRLPGLPQSALIAERALAVALITLLGGVVAGGVAIGPDHAFTAFHPTVVLAVVSIVLMAAVIILRATRRLGARGLAWGILATLIVDVGIVVSLQVGTPHA